VIAKSIFNHPLTISRIFSFVFSVLRHDKTKELFSFILWELKYVLGFYKAKMIKFNSSPFINLTEKALISCAFLKKTATDWNIICFDKNGDLYGSKKINPEQLYLWREGKSVPLFALCSEITGIFIAESGTLFVSSGGKVFRYSSGTLSDGPVFEFSTTKSIFLSSAFTEDKYGTLFVGEYVNLFYKKWHFAAYLYCSTDDGKSWIRTDFLKEKGTNKHIHIVKWSPLLDGLVLTDGDNNKKLWFCKSGGDCNRMNPGLGWKDISKRHVKMGGYTTMLETDNRIIFGTDYNGGTNFLVSTADLSVFDKRVIPNPYRRSRFTNMVMTRQNGSVRIWAGLLGDSGGKIKSLLMMSADEGQTWNKIIEYDGKLFRVNILNNSKQIHDKLYISIEKCLLENATDNIRQSELKTSAAINKEYATLNTYVVEYSFTSAGSSGHHSR
jgi:hypothetical protein